MLHGPNSRLRQRATESVNVKVAAGVLARLRAVKAAIMLDPSMASDDGSLLATAALLKLSEVERRLAGPVRALAYDDDEEPAEAEA